MDLGRIVFIGGGAMAEAILKGIIRSNLAEASSLTVCDIAKGRREYLQATYGVSVTADNAGAVQGASVVIFAVKPQVAAKAITPDVAAAIPEEATVLSIMGSTDLARLGELVPSHRIIRVMPNTPLAVGAGMSAYALSELATELDCARAEAIFGSSGEVVRVEESAMEAITAISGCGPGYVFVLIDALADAGVRAGLARDLAIRLAAQTFAGSGRMVLETGKHPAVLRDMVTSPGGTTIAGIYALEARSVRAAMYEAVEAVLERSAELKKG